IGQITLDNASNCRTMMDRLEQLCRKHQPAIQFHREGNRIRYATWQGYRGALARDPVGLVRRVVADLRSSGQRRAALRNIIKAGNESKSWPRTPFDAFDSTDDDDPLKSGGTLPEVQLLRDCETRWSSTYLMIVRLMTLFPAVRSLLNNSDVAISSMTLTPEDRRVLRDILLILRILHYTQSLLCGEKTPTLSFALPVYESLLTSWRELKSNLPQLAPYIDVGICKIEEYVNHARSTRAYALAMVLNPGCKFEWMKEHWSSQDHENARQWTLEVVRRLNLCSQTSTDAQPNSDAGIPGPSSPNRVAVYRCAQWLRYQQRELCRRRSPRWFTEHS
ncbi:hypothetical protein K474DRAFT_1609945, partial [Panus rudis PR-1116 ss-1]